MSLKYNNFRYYWAVVTEKRLKVSTQRYHTSPLIDKSAYSSEIDIFEK